MKKLNVLVTGGSGFIGRHLTDILLAKNYNISLLDRSAKNTASGIRLFKGDVCNRKVVTRAMKGMDYVYHLAGLLGTEELLFNSAEAIKVNVIGAVNIMEEAIRNRTKLLLVSKPNPWLNTYSITKETSEKFCFMYRKEFGLKAVIVKWFSVYGPGQKYGHIQKAVPTFIVRALQNKPLPVFDRGRQTADFIYVSDAARATVMVAESPSAEGNIVEIGTGNELRVIDLARMVLRLTHSKSEIKYLPLRKGEDKNARVVADTLLLRKLTGFKPQVDLESGMRQTVEYYRNLLNSGVKNRD
jgi:nucleoside-diphosphate-sugar epimerase